MFTPLLILFLFLFSVHFLAQEYESTLKLHLILHPILFQALLAFWYLTCIWQALNLLHASHSLLIPGPNNDIYQRGHL